MTKRYSSFIFLSCSFFSIFIIPSCKITHTTTQNSEPLISLERTGCFGRCPIYKISVYENRQLIYEGIRFTEKAGKFCVVLSKKEFTTLENSLMKANFRAMKDKYPDDKVVADDLPSCIVKYAQHGYKKAIIDDDHQSPETLLSIEKELDDLVKIKKLQRCDK